MSSDHSRSRVRPQVVVGDFSGLSPSGGHERGITFSGEEPQRHKHRNNPFSSRSIAFSVRLACFYRLPLTILSKIEDQIFHVPCAWFEGPSLTYLRGYEHCPDEASDSTPILVENITAMDFERFLVVLNAVVLLYVALQYTIPLPG